MAVMKMINPRSRRKSTRKTTARRKTTRAATTRRRRRNPVARPTVRRRRRNPIAAKGVLKNAVSIATESAIGAGSAVAVDMAFARMTFLPANLQTGNAGHATKAILGVAAGALVENVMKGAKGKKLAHNIASGVMTVNAYKIAQGMIPGAAVGEYLNEYVNGDSLGFYDPEMYSPGRALSEPMPGLEHNLGEYVDTGDDLFSESNDFLGAYV